MDLSIVIPVYNSEEIIDKLIDEIVNTIKDINMFNSFEIILIDDFSHDGSWTLIKDLSKKYKFIKGIKLIRNFGQHNAILAGLNECNGEKIITMDDDLQHSPKSIKKLIDEINNGYSVCYTKYINRQHPLWKKIVSWLNNLVSSYLLNKPYNIYLSSYRCFDKKVKNEIIKYSGTRVYIDGLILKSSRNISIIPVEHNKRISGLSNYNFSRLLSLWADMSTTFPIYPIRLASIFRIIILLIVLSIRKILALKNKNESLQFKISEKTYS